jgi:CBS domain-containing protein
MSSVARDIMVTRLVTLTPHMPVLEGIRRLLRSNITGAPVVGERGEYLAVFSERSCLQALVRAADRFRESTRIRINATAMQIMARKLVTLRPEMDVIDAIELLLRNRISGAPVLDGGRFVGVFSEKNSMKVLLDAAYDQHPTSEVRAYMNPDLHRSIAPETDVLTIARMFLETHYRRLEVLQGERLIGQISRRDVVRAMFPMLERIHGNESNTSLSAVDPNLSCEIDKYASMPIASFMDTDARVVDDETDLLHIAQVFLSTNFRRLPVVWGTELRGQISRRDVLIATHDLMAPPREREANLLYLSSIHERHAAPIV